MTIASSSLPTNPTAEEFAARRKLLTDALRSGEYAQTRFKLRHLVPNSEAPEGYCCLGVACELFRKATGQGEWSPPNAVSGCAGFLIEGESVPVYSVLPSAVQQWFGFSSQSGGFDSSEYPTGALFRLNDTRRLSFAQIADVIDAQPKGLFVE